MRCLLFLLALIPATAFAAPRLSVECPDAIARLTWDALSEAIRAWRVPDVEIDVLCRMDGSGRIETRLRGQRAIAELPPVEFGGPDRVVEIAEVQVDGLMQALGTARAPAPRWILRVGLGARVIGLSMWGPGLSFQVDRRFGLFRGGVEGVIRLGIDAGLAQAAEPEISAVTSSGIALIGARKAWRTWALDAGLGARVGWAVIDGQSPEVIGRAADAWYGPVLQAGVGVPFSRRGALRLGLEGGYSFAGPVLSGITDEPVRHDGGWVAIDLAMAMAF